MKLRPAVYAGIVLAAAISRIVPHAPNFTPIGALALFAGASFEEGFMAFAVPAAAMLLSDAILGFHRDMPSVYLSFLLTILAGRSLRSSGKIRMASSIAAASLATSTVFYALTNFSVWLTSGLYPHTGTGLVACYVMAVPFFGNTVAGGLFYSLVMFGSARLADRTILRPVAA